MPPAAPLGHLSFRHLVAACFAERPSLRSVMARAAFEALADRYPWIRSNHPQLQSLEGMTILPAPAGDGSVWQRDLVETLLEHFLSSSPMALAATDQLSLSPPEVFRPQPQAPSLNCAWLR